MWNCTERQPMRFYGVKLREWEGSILSLIPRIRGAVEVKGNRPIARLCTKCITAYAAPSLRFRQVMEEYQLITDAQEGFRKNRSTKRQLAKLKWMGEDQQQRRYIVVQLDMDLANAFNAPNHRPIIQIIEKYGFHPNDVAFLKRMLQNMWVNGSVYLKSGLLARLHPEPGSLHFNPESSPCHDRGQRTRILCNCAAEPRWLQRVC